MWVFFVAAGVSLLSTRVHGAARDEAGSAASVQCVFFLSSVFINIFELIFFIIAFICFYFFH